MTYRCQPARSLRSELGHSMHLLIAYMLLIAAVASLTYGLIGWHASSFDMNGVWLYDNGWRPHPVHFVALGIGLAAPMLWDIFTLALTAGERQYDAKERNAKKRADRAARTRVTSEKPASAGGAVVAAASHTASDQQSPPSPRVFFRPITAADRAEFLQLTQDSRDFHAPWIKAPLTAHTFKAYLRRALGDDHAGYAICRRDGGEMVGVVNINNIIGGALRAGTLAYFVAEAQAGKGYMREGLTQVQEHAFQELRLHRLEANIQPDNVASIALVRSCGFVLEGTSSRFLYINGAWRDHERWAAVDDREGLR